MVIVQMLVPLISTCILKSKRMSKRHIENIYIIQSVSAQSDVVTQYLLLEIK